MKEPKYVPYSIQIFRSDECYHGQPVLFLITGREFKKFPKRKQPSWFYDGHLLNIGNNDPFPGYGLKFRTTIINVCEEDISSLEESVERLFPQLHFPKGPSGGPYR